MDKKGFWEVAYVNDTNVANIDESIQKEPSLI
jgi:hypothetical protein